MEYFGKISARSQHHRALVSWGLNHVYVNCFRLTAAKLMFSSLSPNQVSKKLSCTVPIDLFGNNERKLLEKKRVKMIFALDHNCEQHRRLLNIKRVQCSKRCFLMATILSFIEHFVLLLWHFIIFCWFRYAVCCFMFDDDLSQRS